MRDRPSRTAEAVCLMRASDQRRDPEMRIVDDPYAKLFLGSLTKAALLGIEATGRLGEQAEQHLTRVTSAVLTRHRFMDDRLAAALEAGGVEQLVLLGAGYDTRAYRFSEALGEIPVFEVDHPSTSARKAEIVASKAAELPAANVHRVEIDFQTQSIAARLVESGFVAGKKNFVVWEGVSMYLTRDAVKATLHTVRDTSAPGSRLTMDFWFLLDAPDIISTAHRASPNLLHLLGEPITFGIHPEDVGDFLKREGLGLVELADPDALESRYIKDGRKTYRAMYVIEAETGAPT